jgi:outer membrane protein OmpA-like peptidoglycan-associated protein
LSHVEFSTIIYNFGNIECEMVSFNPVKIFPMKKLSLSFVCLVVSSVSILARDNQEKIPYHRWEIGINGGLANFAGSSDINKMYNLNHFNDFHCDFNFGYGLFVKKNFTNVFALEGAYNGTTLTGTPKVLGYNPFKTGVNEIGLNTVWNINNLFSRNKFDRRVYWYAKIGTGVTHVKNILYTYPATVQGPWKYWTIPLGTGIVVRLSDKMRVDIGTQWSWVNTNSLDGVLQGGPLSGTGYMMGNIRERYLYTHAGISFMLGKKKVKTAPVVSPPKSQPKPEPKPEPKPVPPPPPPKHVTPACVGQIYKVYFAFDKWELNPDSKAELDRLAREMQEYPEVMLDMKSYTDSRGPASYNMKLSEKRGKSVLDYLSAKGISVTRVIARAFGETQPVNKCVDGVKCTEAEYALNRRTETLVIE